MRILPAFLLLALLLTPTVALATSHSGATAEFTNPLTDVNDLGDLLDNIIRWLIGLVALLAMTVVGGLAALRALTRLAP